MPVNGKSRRSYRGAPVSNTLGVTLAEAATNITLAIAVSGWSTDAEPFFVVVDPGTSKEEKICVKYASSTTLTVVDPASTSTWSASANGRGADGTIDRQHEQGAVIYPVFTATEANQANELVSKYANAGSLVYQGSGTPGTFTELSIGSASHVLRINSGVPAWGQVTADGIDTGAVTSEKILNNTIVLGDLATALQAFLVPVGTINAYPGDTAPAGWLLCNGSAFSSATYPTLYALLGNVATTPDFQGHTLVGKGSAPFNGALLSKFGNTNTTAGHTHSVYHDHGSQDTGGDSAEHTHGINLPNTPSGALTTVAASAGDGKIATQFDYTQSTTSGRSAGHTHTVDILPNTVTSGDSSAAATHGNVQPSALVNYIIKHD
jgi:microcystin-dependent protein